MPSKIPPSKRLPYLHPKFTPDHPENQIPDFRVDDGGYWGEPRERTERERKKLQKEWLEKAMDEWNPPHVVRSWELDVEIAERRQGILKLVLSPRVIHPFERLPEYDENRFKSTLSKEISESLSLNDTELEEGKRNFRQFAHKTLHLGYHRFHASHGEPNIPSEEEDPNISPEEICWIMEYTENECNIIRRKIASLMGLYPAAMDENSPGYNVIEHGLWENRVYARCRRRNKKCIRPEHIILFGSNFQDIP